MKGENNENPIAGSSAELDGVRRGNDDIPGYGGYGGYWRVIPYDSADAANASVLESLIRHLLNPILTSYDTSGFPYDPDCAIDIDLTG